MIDAKASRKGTRLPDGYYCYCKVSPGNYDPHNLGWVTIYQIHNGSGYWWCFAGGTAHWRKLRETNHSEQWYQDRLWDYYERGELVRVKDEKVEEFLKQHSMHPHPTERDWELMNKV